MILDRLKTVGIVVGILTAAGLPGWNWVEARIQKEIVSVVKKEISKELRDMKVLVEFNRMQAEKDPKTKDDWNKAIDLIDNGGTVR